MAKDFYTVADLAGVIALKKKFLIISPVVFLCIPAL